MTPTQLNKILWLKNVNPEKGEEWAYDGLKRGDLNFKLHWPTNAESNAREPKIGDLIILIKHAKLTHLVEITGIVEPTKNKKHKFVRAANVLWSFFDQTPSVEADPDAVLGFKYRCRNGKAIWLQNCEGFTRRWKASGLSKMQEQVAQKLKV